MKHPDGQALVRRLAERADVLLENFRPGVLDRLGLSYAALREANPRLIYCSISGFGRSPEADTGPGSDPWDSRPGYDVVVQGMGGFAALTGEAAGPPMKAGLSIADLVSGLNATIGVLLALHARTRSGRGQHVDVSMLDGQVALLTYHAGMYLNAGRVPRRMGNRHPSIAPYETYRTADGFINVAVASEGLWRAFCKLLMDRGLDGSPPLGGDPRFQRNRDRVEHREALGAALEPILLTRPSGEWLADLEAAGVPCGPILNVDELLGHERVRARGMVQAVPHPSLAARGGPAEVTLTGVPIKLSETPGALRAAPPLLGEHREALRDLLGLGEDELLDLQRRGVLG
jgi:formyl-CoA transferase/CoA:oxalate CoA-transferase